MAKMVAGMIALAIPLSIAEHSVYELWPLFGESYPFYLDHFLWHAVAEGAYWGGAVGIAMALVTAVLYRRIRKPLLYQFAMVIVATAVTLVTQPIQLPWFIELTVQAPNGGIWLIAYISRSALMIYASLIVARMCAAQAAKIKSKTTYA